MATVSVIVNGRPYSVGCEDGQEAHVEALARDFDKQVQDVGAQVGQVGDLRLFLMAALVTADDLADAKLRLAQAQSLAKSQLTSAPATPQKPDPRAIAALNDAAAAIEALAEKLD